MNKVKTKGIMDFIKEDKSLSKKITYEEYENKKAVPKNSDIPIEKAYEAYLTVLERQ